MHNWVSLWDLRINFDKCNVMHFRRRNNIFYYYIGYDLIIESTCEKILGIFVNNKLHFSEHIYECI